ncbi:30S ribosomal protein S6, partial [Frankliniella fusca]
MFYLNSLIRDSNHASQQETSERPEPATASTSWINSAALAGKPDLQRDWLRSMGVLASEVPSKTTPASSSICGESSSLTADDNMSLGREKSEDDMMVTQDIDINSNSDDDDEYSRASLANKRENNERLMQLVQPKVPKVKKHNPKKKKGRGKENEPLQALQPVQLRRSKRIAAMASGPPEKEDSEFDLNPDDALSPAEDMIPQKTIQPQGPPSHRIGGAITKYTPLTPFTDEVREAVKKGILHQEQADVEIMNRFMTKHVREITGGTMLTKNDYKQLRIQLKFRSEEMGVDQAENFMKKIVYSLSVRLRNERRKETRKERQKAERAARQSMANQQAISTQSKDSNSSSNVDLDDDDDDDLLRKPVINETSIKYALSSSSKRYTIIQSMTVSDAMITYPYLTKPELVISDYLQRFSKSTGAAEKNFESTVPAIRIILDLEFTIENELDKLRVILHMDEHFTNREDIWPLIQFCDEANRRATPLDQIPVGQSAALVILHTDKDLSSATVVFDGQALLTLTEPTAFQSIALLMAMYFIYHLEYPESYSKQLRILELILHGEELRNENVAVQKFMEKVDCAKQVLCA